MIYCKDLKERFETGNLVATKGIVEIGETVEGFNKHLAHTFYELYCKGIWGDLSEEDKEENEKAIREGYRIFGAYTVKGIAVWIITEWDRSTTTILLPEEY